MTAPYAFDFADAACPNDNGPAGYETAGPERNPMSKTATATRDDERSMHDLLDSLRPCHTVSAEFRTAYGAHTLTGPVLPGLYQDNRKRTLIGELTENLRDAHGNLSADLYSITITEA